MKELSASAIRRGLDTIVVGRNIICRESLPSTMDAARDAARNGAAEGTVVIAGEQLLGRGRLQRSWLAPAGNIALSVILYPAMDTVTHLIMMASLAVCRAIERVTGLEPQIKWPNDILIAGRKVCGILIENELRPGGAVTAIIGMGINVGLQPDTIVEIASSATSLQRETGNPVSRTEIIRKLLEALDELYAAGDKAAVCAAWRARLVTLGKHVTVTWKDKVLEGIAETVDESGALTLRLPDGSSTSVVAGDVTLRTG